jgi:hypothetical protein
MARDDTAYELNHDHNDIHRWEGDRYDIDDDGTEGEDSLDDDIGGREWDSHQNDVVDENQRGMQEELQRQIDEQIDAAFQKQMDDYFGQAIREKDDSHLLINGALFSSDNDDLGSLGYLTETLAMLHVDETLKLEQTPSEHVKVPGIDITSDGAQSINAVIDSIVHQFNESCMAGRNSS